VAIALTSCKGPEGADANTSAPSGEETISMTTACDEVLPLAKELGALMNPIMKNASENVSNDENVNKFNSILDDLDGIAESIDTEEGRTMLLDMTKAWDKVLEAITSGGQSKDSNAALNKLQEVANAWDAKCKY
jgi:hypothetical protein